VSSLHWAMLTKIVLLVVVVRNLSRVFGGMLM
jgi:hypothetical protein